MPRARIRPSKPASVFTMVVGIALVVVGVSAVVPEFGAFGLLWTLVALGITVFSAINAFTTRGVAGEVVEFDPSTQPTPEPRRRDSVEDRLSRLEQLRRRGLLSDAEFHEQRNRILADL